MTDAAGRADMADPASARLLAAHLADCTTGWSMGTFGAIAEFTRDSDEHVTATLDAATPALVTPRGGLRLSLPHDTRLIASESLTRDSWSQRVALCLPHDRCAMSGRRVLTELGADHDVLRPADRDGILFDLGLGCLQVDVCVRIADVATIAALRRAAGQPVFVPGSLALPALMAANPHRVFLTRCGRVEVFQPIPPPDGRSPDGPHTHILPKLLAADRTHAATEPLPDGWIPCAHFYPAHPQRDALGKTHPFRRGPYDDFQHVLADFGAPELVALKREVIARIAAGDRPSSTAHFEGRHARAALRITLRQMQAAGDASPVLQDWLATFDQRSADDAIDPMEQLHGPAPVPERKA